MVLLPSALVKPEAADYMVYQLEKCPKTARLHLQGYLHLDKKVRLAAFKKMPHPWDTAHFEQCKGTPAQNKAYCTKEESRVDGPWELGVMPAGQGKRTDLHDACDLIKSGATMKRVAEEMPTQFVKFGKGLDALRKTINAHVDPPKFTNFKQEFWALLRPVAFIGASGIGKTEFALAHFKAPLLVRHMDTLSEFDPTMHDGLVFDDMSFTHMPVEARIHLLDSDRPSDIHIRYKTVHIPAHTKKIFCHNNPDLFVKADEKITEAQTQAIERRVEYVFFQESLF